MTRVVSRQELARALCVDEPDVDRWVQDGCPCFRIRERLVLFDKAEVSAWREHLQCEAITPLVDRVLAASTPEDVAAIARELPALVARGLLSRAGARDVRYHLARLARELAHKRRSP